MKTNASMEWRHLVKKMVLFKKVVGKSWGKELSKRTRIDYRRLHEVITLNNEPSFTKGIRINAALDSWAVEQKAKSHELD